MDGKVVTFGEIMVRLTPEGYNRFTQTDRINMTYAGAEANVAVSLANYGMDCVFVSKLPEHEIGQAAVNSLRRFGVDTSHVLRGGDRAGIYFLERGASQRPSSVIYDRKGSAVSQASPDEFDWKSIFEGARWFHFTGITPALSDNTARACLEAAKTARDMGITVSCDLNYRNKLWSRDKARECMSEIMRCTDVCIANEEDAKDVFGIEARDSDIANGKISPEGYADVAMRLREMFGLRYVAITLRESINANINDWSGLLCGDDSCVFSKKYRIHIVDRVGGGDSFAAGLIYGLTHGFSDRDSVEFAVAASCLKHTVEGDFNLVSADEVLRLMGGDVGGRVRR